MSFPARLPLSLALAFLLVSCRQPPEAFLLPEGITFRDLASGREINPREYRGRVLVLHLWAAWSPASIREIPELAEFSKLYAQRGLVILGVCLDESSAAELVVFAERQGARYPLVRPGPRLLDEIQPLETIPYTVLYSPGGKVLARFRATWKTGELREVIKKNL